MFVGDAGNSLLGEYSLGSTGATFINYKEPRNLFGVAVSPNGSFLFVANEVSNTITSYSIGTGRRAHVHNQLGFGEHPVGRRR